MALQSEGSDLFSIALICEGVNLFGSEVSSYLISWTKIPISNDHFPQDSLGSFMLSNLLLAKFDIEIEFTWPRQKDQRSRSFFAVAEINYWLNRNHLTLVEKIVKSRRMNGVLFHLENPYTLDSVHQSYHVLTQRKLIVIENISALITIDKVFPDQILAVSRKAIKDIEFQKGILGFPEGTQMVYHAISFLQYIGNLTDIPAL